MPDRFLKVYDVRMLRALSPVPVVGEPFLLRFLPSFSSQLAIISAMGHMQILDAAAPASSALQLLQVNTEGAMCMALEMSSSCQYLAVGDSGGYLHTFTSNPLAPFNSFSRPSEFADPLEITQPMSIDDYSTPLSSIPVPYPNGPLLSDWPDQFTRRKYRLHIFALFIDRNQLINGNFSCRRVPTIDHSILTNMRMVGTIGYAPNPANHRPNQVPYGSEKRSQRGRKHSISDPIHPKGILLFLQVLVHIYVYINVHLI